MNKEVRGFGIMRVLFFMIMTYLEKLKSPKWQKKRLEILERDNFSCKCCNDTETELHVHHLKYFGEPYEAPNKYLQTLCKDCHFIIEFLKDVLEKNETPKISKWQSKIVVTSIKATFIFSIVNKKIIDEGLCFPRNSEFIKYLYDTNKL